MLDQRSKQLRRMVLDALRENSLGGHLAPAFSIFEIVRVLFDDIMRVDQFFFSKAARDHFILSKGHGCLALYALLADKGLLDKKALSTVGMLGASLGGHPERSLAHGIEATTGALGHGLPMSVGLAIGKRLSGFRSRVYVLVGDGELNEGSNWEAVAHAAKHELDNLALVVDLNGHQCFGPTQMVLPNARIFEHLRAAGVDVVRVDGHDVLALRSALSTLPPKGVPRAVICQTIKGKGISELEDDPSWHYRERLAVSDLDRLVAGLDGYGDAP